MDQGHLVEDRVEFGDWMSRVSRAVDVHACLPRSPFTRTFSHYSFEEFDWLMSGDAWPALRDLGKAAGDSTLLVAVIDPDPVNYYFAEFGLFNWVLARLDAAPETYWTLLNREPPGSPADSIVANSNTVLWMAESLTWVIWGERDSGLCVLASEYSVPWRDLAWARSYCQRIDRGKFSEGLAEAFGSR